MRKTRTTHSRFSAYLLNHAQVTLASLGRLYRQPIATLMTTAVIAIALTLPTGLFVMVNSLSKLSNEWNNSAQISVYLYPQVNKQQAQNLVQHLRLNNNIRQIKLIDKKSGLQQFKKISGFNNALKYLDTNPLPIVLAIQPDLYQDQNGQLADQTTQLVHQLEKNKLVEMAQLDEQWVKRLLTLLEIANRGIWIVGTMLALAVLLIIGNTIRLDIQNRHAEIEVAKLIGASDAFIRRPFLYTGFWYGLLGGLLAWLLTSTSLFLIGEPVHRLARLYHSNFSLHDLGANNVFTLLSISCILGLAGSWLAVSRHLKEIEPG